MRWDASFAPVIAQERVFFGSSADGRICALDVESGQTVWTFFTGGPVRFAPYVFDGQLYAVSDDGYLYCLSTRDGSVTWKFRGGLYFTPGTASGQTGGDEHAVTPDGVVYVNVGNKQDGKLHRSNYRKGSRTDRRGKPVRLLALDSDETIAGMSGEPTALIVAGKHAIVGFPGKIVVCDLDGQEPRREHAVAGTVYGLAYAHGRLIASTDRGEILCFLSGGDKQEFRQVGCTTESGVKNAALAVGQPGRTAVAGYTLVLGGSDFDTIAALVAPESRHVVVIDRREPTIDALRKHFHACGLYGPHITALVADTKQTPLPNRFANLIVENGAGTPRAEVQRLLIPRTGRFQSSRSAKPVKLDTHFAGEGTWTHSYHDPANTLYSEDTVVKGPLAIRWFKDLDLVMPNREGRSAPPLYLDGRMYVEGIDALVCADAYSGAELWRLPLPGVQKHMDQSHYSGSSTGGNMCLDSDHLYLIRDGHCLKIDPTTGRVQGKLVVPQSGKAWGYLAVKNGILYGSIPNTDFHVRWLWRRSDMEAIYTESRSLFAMDPASGKVLWQYDAKDSIRHNAIAITNKRVFLIDRPIAELDSIAHQNRNLRAKKPTPEEHPHGMLVAIDAFTGKRLWSNQEGIYGTTLAVNEAQGVLVAGYSKVGFTLPSEFGGRMTGYRVSDGEVLWDLKAVPGDRSRFIIRDRDVVLEPYAYDLTTGAKIDGFELKRAYGCGPAVASRNLLLFRSGTLGYCGAAGDKPVQNFGGIRPGCWFNFIPVGGMVLMPDASERCTCSYLNKATIALEERMAEPIVTTTPSEDGLTVSIQRPERCELRCTLDGMPPTIESPPPPPLVRLRPGTVLKIKAFMHGMPPSETVVVSNE